MDQLGLVFRQFHPDNLFRAAVLLVGGWFLSRLAANFIAGKLKTRMRPHQLMLVRRMIFILLLMLFLASAFQELNFRISALLGATGILTVAIGIASQTSMSNLVSGLFLIGEKPFEIGDNITADGISGQIISIDSMSVRICTPDNTMVRIPNEILIKSAFTNLSYFPTRRINLPVSIAYQESIDRAIKILLDLCDKNPLCLPDPAPNVVVDSLGESGINLQLQVWTRTEDRGSLHSLLQKEIRETFEREKIEIPWPSKALFDTDPENGFAVRLISAKLPS